MSHLGQKRSTNLPTAPVNFRIPPYSLDMHVHPEGHLVYVHRGKMILVLKDAAWAVFGPSLCWVPGACQHGGQSINSFTGAVFWQSELGKLRFPSHACRLVLPAKIPPDGFLAGSRGRDRSTLSRLLHKGTTIEFPMRVPRSAAMYRLAVAMLAEPHRIQDQVSAANLAGMSVRSFTRHFNANTGMSFGRWRSLLLTHCADALFRDEEPVASIAHQLGYQSASAFIAMYRRVRGRTLCRADAEPSSTSPLRVPRYV